MYFTNLKHKLQTDKLLSVSDSVHYKDHRLYRATPPGKGYKYRFLFIFLITACFTSVLVLITNS